MNHSRYAASSKGHVLMLDHSKCIWSRSFKLEKVKCVRTIKSHDAFNACGPCEGHDGVLL